MLFCPSSQLSWLPLSDRGSTIWIHTTAHTAWRHGIVTKLWWTRCDRLFNPPADNWRSHLHTRRTFSSLKADRPHPRDYSTHKQTPRTDNDSYRHKHSSLWKGWLTDRRYQVHYLPRFVVDNDGVANIDHSFSMKIVTSSPSWKYVSLFTNQLHSLLYKSLTSDHDMLVTMVPRWSCYANFTLEF